MSILSSSVGNIAGFASTSYTAQSNLQKSISRISSGSRINDSSVDSAGLSLANRLHANQVSLQKGIENANMGISMLQTAEGSLSEISNVIIRMRELAVQSSNETYSDNDRSMLNNEYKHLYDEIDRISVNSTFNGFSLLQNTDSDFQLQVGYLNDSTHRISIDLSNLQTTTTTLSMSSITSIGTRAEALDTFNTLDNALNSVNEKRTYIGSFTNRLDSALAEAQTLSTNLTASHSRIIDLDYASESANMTRFRILHQSSVAALGQARSIHRSNLGSIFNQL
jgi:flagellin